MHQYPIISNYYYFLMDWKSETTKKHIDEAKALGLTLLGAGKNANYRLYLFNDCGHEQEIQTGDVKRNNRKCDQCFKTKLNKESKDAGLTILGPSENNGYRLYRFNDCGHEKELAMASVRRNCTPSAPMEQI